MIDDNKLARPYVERLRRDPRTAALFESWVIQGTEIARQRACHPLDMGRIAAEEALKLALTFILDEDAEYRAVCKERDDMLARLIETIETQPRPLFVAPPLIR